MKNKHFILLLLTFLPFQLQAWCVGKFGNTCKSVIVIGAAGAQRDAEDGGAKNKRIKGNKEKFQGYAEYREHFIYYGYSFLAAPHQRGNFSSEPENREYAYEYAFNPFLSGKIQRSEYLFESFEENRDEIKHEHTHVMLNLRLYFASFVFRTGIGVGNSAVKISGGEKGDFSGQTNMVQNSVFYVWGDENTMLGITSTTISGRDQDKENLGSSSYSISAAIGL